MKNNQIPKVNQTPPVDNEQIIVLQTKINELETNWKRALADYQNLVKRTQDQQYNLIQYSNLSLINKLIPILDHLDLAASHLKDPGLDMVVNQFVILLDEEGVKPILAINHLFDPNLMECVEQIEGEKNKVVAVVTKGYQINGKVIRPSKVKVGKGN